MFVIKLKWLAPGALTVGLLLPSAGLVTHQTLAAGQPQQAQKPADPPKAEDKKTKTVDKQEAIKKELERLEGTWTIVAWEIAGQKLADEALKDLQAMPIVIKGNEWTQTHPQWMYKETLQIDPTKDPKTIDMLFRSPRGKILTRGIYSLTRTTDGERLTICRASDQAFSRPKEFKTTAERGEMLVVLKRADK
jgi:uncharacterized protein (TIGR03067 family)